MFRGRCCIFLRSDECLKTLLVACGLCTQTLNFTRLGILQNLGRGLSVQLGLNLFIGLGGGGYALFQSNNV